MLLYINVFINITPYAQLYMCYNTYILITKKQNKHGGYIQWKTVIYILKLIKI